MQHVPYYAAFPWPLDEIFRFWDGVFATANAHHTLFGIDCYFWPYTMMANSTKFSDFGTAS